MEADNRAWVRREPPAVRALPVALTDQARAWKHDKDLSNRLTDQAVGLLGHGAVLATIGARPARKLPDCATPAREQFTGLAEAGDVEIAIVILVRDHEYACEDRLARRVREKPAAAVESAAAASQIPADCDPEVYDEGFWSRVDAWSRQPGITGPRRHYAGIGGARGRVMAWPAAGYGVVAAGGLRGEEDEQA